MPSTPQIISDLMMIMQLNHELELMNTYKGVPFICKARVQNIDGDNVWLQAGGPAILCLERERLTKVLGSDYFEPSVAHAVSVDFRNGIIVLNNFSYLGTKLGERMTVRVEPKEPIDALLINQTQKTSGQVADLSLSGVGVRVAQAHYSPALKPGTLVQIQLELMGKSIAAEGTILSVLRLDDAQRVSIRFAQDHGHRLEIFRYLVDRRAQIEEELNAEYDAIMRQVEGVA
jgi:PilZ domain